MSKGRVLYIRNAPYDINVNSYNVQEMGLGKAFCSLGYDFDCVVFKKKNQKEWIFYEQDGCLAKWIEKPRIRIFRMGINLSICRADFLQQYDVIISSEYMEIMTYFISKKFNNTYMYSGPYYNLFMTNLGSIIYDRLFTKDINRHVKTKFVKSPLAQEFLVNKGYNNIVTVGVGLDTERYEKNVEILPETQEVVDYMKSHQCILYVGALSDRKNLPFMLDVYKKVIQKYPDVRFVMIGKSVINPYLKLFGKKDEDYERICFSKIAPDVRSGILRIKSIENTQLKYIYPLAKAFLLPSKQEIFGMVLLESMYLGAPVITSKNGGSTTLIKDNDCGIMIDDFDSHKWADQVIELINNPEKSRLQCMKASRKVKENFNWLSIAKKMESYMTI